MKNSKKAKSTEEFLKGENRRLQKELRTLKKELEKMVTGKVREENEEKGCEKCCSKNMKVMLFEKIILSVCGKCKHKVRTERSDVP